MSKLRDTYSQITDTESNTLIRGMTLDGDPDGDMNMAVDGSITPVEFYVAPLHGFQFFITIISIELSDSGVPVLSDYGSITGPLTNGIQFFIDHDGDVIDLFQPAKDNRDLLKLAPTLSRRDFAGNQSLEIYTFNTKRHSNAPIILNSASNDRFGVRVQDDVRALTAHSVVVKGNIRLRDI